MPCRPAATSRVSTFAPARSNDETDVDEGCGIAKPRDNPINIARWPEKIQMRPLASVLNDCNQTASSQLFAREAAADPALGSESAAACPSRCWVRAARLSVNPIIADTKLALDEH